MRASLTTLVLCAALAIAMPAAAHDEDFTFSGTVTAVAEKTLKVKTAQNIEAKVWLGRATRVKLGDKPATTKDIKVGQVLKIEGSGEDLNDVNAHDVTILPANTAAKR